MSNSEATKKIELMIKVAIEYTGDKKGFYAHFLEKSTKYSDIIRIGLVNEVFAGYEIGDRELIYDIASSPNDDLDLIKAFFRATEVIPLQVGAAMMRACRCGNFKIAKYLKWIYDCERTQNPEIQKIINVHGAAKVEAEYNIICKKDGICADWFRDNVLNEQCVKKIDF